MSVRSDSREATSLLPQGASGHPCAVCVDLVLNKDLTRVSIWSRKIHQNLEGRNLGPSDQCAKNPSMEEAVCVPSAAQQAQHLSAQHILPPTLACRTQNGNDYLDRGLENVWATSTLFLQIAGFCTSCNNVLKL